jgi:hypothetical protein
MTTTLKTAVEDLYDVPEHGKAEIVNGEIKVYRASDPDRPDVYRRGEIANAEPVPGWTFPVDLLFE